MKIACPECSTVVNIEEGQQGKAFTCPTCMVRIKNAPVSLNGSLSLADFQIEEEIGRGEHAVIYRAHQQSLGRMVALKTLAPEHSGDMDAVRSFIRRGRRLAVVSHPTTCHLYGVGEEGGLFFTSLELIKGENLRQWIDREGKLSPGQVVAVATELSIALEANWKTSGMIPLVIHPEHVMLDKDNVVRLLDPGRPVKGETLLPNEPDETLITDPALLAPEISIGHSPNLESGFHALGILLFQALTGEPLFAANDDKTCAGGIIVGKLPAYDEFAPETPENLRLLICRLLDREPGERFSSSEALISFLQSTPETGSAPELAADSGADLWVCAKCNTSNSTRGKYCRKCGAYGLVPCPTCSQEIHEQADFCPFCGGDAHANRNALQQQAKVVLQKLAKAVQEKRWEEALESIRHFEKFNQDVLSSKLELTFVSQRSQLVEKALRELARAKEGFYLGHMSQVVKLLQEIIPDDPETIEAAKDLHQIETEMADAIYQANAALKTRCFHQCWTIMNELLPWTGGALGKRREELLLSAKEKMKERERAIVKAEELLKNSGVRSEALRARTVLSRYRLSEKLLVVSPSPEDSDAEARMAGIMQAVEKNVIEIVGELLDHDLWESTLELLEHTGKKKNDQMIPERVLLSCINKEIDKRVTKARKLEKNLQFDEAQEAWSHVLLVPDEYLPQRARNEACDFGDRKGRYLGGRRKSSLRRHLSMLSLVWCLAFTLGGVQIILTWYREDLTERSFYVTALPLMLQLLALILFGSGLRIPAILSGGDLISKRQPSWFSLGLLAMWILSPISWILFYTHQTFATYLDYLPDLVRDPIFAFGLMAVFWFVKDLLRSRQFILPPGVFSLTVSWLLASSFILRGNDGPMSAALAFEVNSIQFVVFLVLQVFQNLIYRNWKKKRMHSG